LGVAAIDGILAYRTKTAAWMQKTESVDAVIVVFASPFRWGRPTLVFERLVEDQIPDSDLAAHQTIAPLNGPPP
jgi:hypothetical protein